MNAAVGDRMNDAARLVAEAADLLDHEARTDTAAGLSWRIEARALAKHLHATACDLIRQANR